MRSFAATSTRGARRSTIGSGRSRTSATGGRPPIFSRVAGVRTGPPSSWVPQGKPIWLTEYGFPSVNGATNQPNVFIDAKSVESYAPYYSNRAVDRAVQRALQRAAIEATETFWNNSADNPVSPVYGGPMVGRRFIWRGDARPYPFFPSLTRVWSDSENYRLSHWIAGKIGNMRLSAIVRDLCLRAGLAESEFDASVLDDEVVGYVVVERKPGRDMIAVLQAAYFFDAVERDGKLVFVAPEPIAKSHEKFKIGFRKSETLVRTPLFAK